MPAIINFAANLCLGAAVPLAMRQAGSLRHEFVNGGLMALLAFEALIFTPVATYLFRFHPQWSLLYAFDPQIYPSLDTFFAWMSIAAIFANFAALLGAYTLARRGIILQQTWMSALPLAIGGLIILTVLFAYGTRVAFIGDYDEFWQGQAGFFLIRIPGIIGVLLYGLAGALVYLLHKRLGHYEGRFLEA